MGRLFAKRRYRKGQEDQHRVMSANHDGAHKPDANLLELEALAALMHSDITEAPPPVITTRVIRLFQRRTAHRPSLR